MPFLTDKLSQLIKVTKPAAIVTYAEFELEVRGALKESDSVRAVILTGEYKSQDVLEKFHFPD